MRKERIIMKFLGILFTEEFWIGFLIFLIVGVVLYLFIDFLIDIYQTKKQKEKKKDLKEEIAFLVDIMQVWEEEIQKEYSKIERVTAYQFSKIDKLYESINLMKEFVDNCHKSLDEKEKELSLLEEKLRGRK